MDDEKETSFSKKSYLGSSIRKKEKKALSELRTLEDYRNIAQNFSNQALQDDIFSILAEIETQPKKFEILLPSVVLKNGELIENPLPERKISISISEEEYLELSGFRKFFLSIAPGQLRNSIHAVGDSIGELSYLNELGE